MRLRRGERRTISNDDDDEMTGGESFSVLNRLCGHSRSDPFSRDCSQGGKREETKGDTKRVEERGRSDDLEKVMNEWGGALPSGLNRDQAILAQPLPPVAVPRWEDGEKGVIAEAGESGGSNELND